MLVPNRHATSTDYRYGFQGQEKDDEIKGEGNSINYTFRMHDPRIGRFFARDPLEKYYAELTPYQFSSNAPIHAVELEGMETAQDMRFERNHRRMLAGEITDDQFKAQNAAEGVGALIGALAIVASYTGVYATPLLRTLFWKSAIEISKRQLYIIGAGNFAIGFLDESGTIQTPGPIDDFGHTTRILAGNWIKGKFVQKFSLMKGKLDFGLGTGTTVSKDLAKVTMKELENMAKY